MSDDFSPRLNLPYLAAGAQDWRVRLAPHASAVAEAAPAG